MSIVKIPTPANIDDTNEPATKKQREEADKAADALIASFDWGNTAEGPKFWEAVYDRLAQIAEDGVLK